MSEPNLVTLPRHRGMVEWFGLREGYGFVRHTLDSNEVVDIFFHINDFKPGVTLSSNQVIEYSLWLTDKGLRATDCVVLKSVPQAEIDRIEPALRLKIQRDKARKLA